MRRSCLILVILVGLSFGDEFDADKIKEQILNNVQIPASLQNTTLPTLDELKRIAKDKCNKVSGGDAAYEAIERGAEELKRCTEGLVDVGQLQDEIKEAEPKGELDTVFNKYCRKRDTATGCVETFTKLLEPCLQPNEIESKQTFVNMVKKFLNFVCYKDGDHIALFIAEKGPECFDQRKDELINCANSTFSSYVPADLSTNLLPSVIPELVIGQKQCK